MAYQVQNYGGATAIGKVLFRNIHDIYLVGLNILTQIQFSSLHLLVLL